MSEESKELELVEKRLDVLERTLFGNGHKGLKAELVELKTQIETFKRIAVWQHPVCASVCHLSVFASCRTVFAFLLLQRYLACMCPAIPIFGDFYIGTVVLPFPEI